MPGYLQLDIIGVDDGDFMKNEEDEGGNEAGLREASNLHTFSS